MSSAFDASRNPNFSRRQALGAFAAAGASAFAAGCGVSEYEARMNATIEDLELSNKFVRLMPAATVLNGPELKQPQVSMRLPILIVPSRTAPPVLLTEGCATPEDGNKVMPPERLKPPAPLPDIPGFQVSLEKFLATAGGNRPCYLYVGVQKATPSEAAAARQQVLDQLKMRMGPNQPAVANGAAWQKIMAPSPKLRSSDPVAPPPVAVNLLEIECLQLFEVRGNVANEITGLFQLMAIESAGYQVFLGWRIPSNAFDRQEFLDAAKAAVGTVKIA